MQKLSPGREALDAAIAPISDDQRAAQPVERDAPWVVELARFGSEFPKPSEILAISREMLDSMVAGVDDPKRLVGAERYPRRTIEASGTGARFSPHTNRFSTGLYRQDRVRTLVRAEHGAFAVHHAHHRGRKAFVIRSGDDPVHFWHDVVLIPFVFNVYADIPRRRDLIQVGTPPVKDEVRIVRTDRNVVRAPETADCKPLPQGRLVLMPDA